MESARRFSYNIYPERSPCFRSGIIIAGQNAKQESRIFFIRQNNAIGGSIRIGKGTDLAVHKF